MKNLSVSVLLFAAANVAIAEPAFQHERAGTDQHGRAAVLGAWLGYGAGGLVGAAVASSASVTLIPLTTTAGVAVTLVSVPFLPVLLGTAAGAVVGASVGYGSVKLYQSLDTRDVLAQGKHAVHSANMKAIGVRDDVIARLTH